MLNPKTKERELCYTVKIDNIVPIEGAERVELAIVGGWRIMVQKNQFKAGDYAIYFEIDSKVPEKEPFMFLAGKHYKIKTQKYFKGTVLSQGLLMAFKDFSETEKESTWYKNIQAILKNNQGILPEIIFLTKALNITYAVEEDNKRKANINKYSKMYQRHLVLFKKYSLLRKIYNTNLGKKILFVFLGKKRDTRGWPAWVVKTDEERVQNLPNLFPTNDLEWIVTEKIDGTSTTFTLKKGKHNKTEFYVCSRNVCFDKPEKADHCYYESNVYLEMAEKYNVEEVLKDILKKNPNWEFVTLQGETYGGEIQNRDYSMKNHDFMAFNLIYKDKYEPLTTRKNPEEMTSFLAEYEIPSVPIVAKHFRLPSTCDELLNYATNVSAVDGKEREGIVLRSYDGTQSFKAVSNEFLIKYHQ